MKEHPIRLLLELLFVALLAVIGMANNRAHASEGPADVQAESAIIGADVTE